MGIYRFIVKHLQKSLFTLITLTLFHQLHSFYIIIPCSIHTRITLQGIGKDARLLDIIGFIRCCSAIIRHIGIEARLHGIILIYIIRCSNLRHIHLIDLIKSFLIKSCRQKTEHFGASCFYQIILVPKTMSYHKRLIGINRSRIVLIGLESLEQLDIRLIFVVCRLSQRCFLVQFLYLLYLLRIILLGILDFLSQTYQDIVIGCLYGLRIAE